MHGGEPLVVSVLFGGTELFQPSFGDMQLHLLRDTFHLRVASPTLDADEFAS